MMVGAFDYMPPVQTLGQEVTPQADLYSFGAMLYDLVTGSPPFAGPQPRTQSRAGDDGVRRRLRDSGDHFDDHTAAQRLTAPDELGRS